MKTIDSLSILACLAAALFVTPARALDVATPAEARAIATEAYIYGYPMVDSYRINFAFYLWPGNPEYKGPQNQLHNMARLFTPEDTAVQTPNSDTPYSFFGADLRAEPFVITVPEIEKDRYFSEQVHAFWSITMYDLPKQLLVANPLNRYLINSPMLPDLKLDADGGLTLFAQHESPGKDLETNWLPAPKGPFFMAMRLYWSKEDALDGNWPAPKLVPLE